MLKKTKTDDLSFTVESVLEKTLEDLTLFLGTNEKAKSTLYDEIMQMVERSLIKIALRRSNNVKMSAAAFLGINRNTLHKKIEQLNISCKEK
ncbi:MAG: helix-turn-helix domain-containing protein [Syntrophaceae bacterium]